MDRARNAIAFRSAGYPLVMSQFCKSCGGVTDMRTEVGTSRHGTCRAMRTELSSAAIVLLFALIAAASSGLIYFVVGSGRSWAAYILGAIAMVSWFTIVVVIVAAFGWLIDRVVAWLKKL
jgi:hypothetical protein